MMITLLNIDPGQFGKDFLMLCHTSGFKLKVGGKKLMLAGEWVVLNALFDTQSF